MISNEKITKLYLDQVATELAKVCSELLELKKDDTNVQMNIKLLRLIANTRICLEASADILSAKGQEFIKDSQEEALKQNFKTLIGNLSLFMKDFRNTDIHLFFQRYVIHKYGRQELANIIENYSFVKFEKQEVGQEVSDLVLS